jgi:hypothetical protein
MFEIDCVVLYLLRGGHVSIRVLLVGSNHQVAGVYHLQPVTSIYLLCKGTMRNTCYVKALWERRRM